MYEAEDAELGRRVAVKTLTAAAARGPAPEWLRRFHREVEALTRIRRLADLLQESGNHIQACEVLWRAIGIGAADHRVR
ncbi:hypothetical protein [Streptomyces sp. NPDC093225]|uniref:hypothetical protein n=1 Tax=Streptomyces sp. NPDC093225 TaxID=3366034 RepID=UPI00382CD7BA